MKELAADGIPVAVTCRVLKLARQPYYRWLADITEHRTGEGKLYLCAIKDVFSNRIVGYSMDSRMKSRLATQALANAVARRGAVAGCIVHSDRGSQFRSRRFVLALGRNDMVGSMGRVGAAGDNAAMESFFSLLQKNVLDRRRWDTREELRIAIVTWIERTYHRRRRQVRDELADIVRLTEVINGLAKRIGDRVREVAPALLAMPGCGELTAAKLVGEAAGVTRFKSEAALARVVFGRLHNDHQNRRKPSQPAAA